MTRIITVANQKGGVGKTTTVVNVSACLASLGNKVLVVDLDPQANCTTGLGVDPAAQEFSIYEVLAQPKKFRIFTLDDIIVRTPWPNLDICPSHVNLSGVELELVNKLGREAILKKGLREASDKYDFIVIDTPPSLSLLTVNALVAATEIMIVMKAEPWSLDGIDNLLETLTVVEEELNPGLGLSGILVNMLEPRATLSQEILKRLANDERLNDRLFSTHIRKNVRLSEAADKGVPVMYHDSECHGAEAYMELTLEILNGRGTASQDEDEYEYESQANKAESEDQQSPVDELEIQPYQISPSLIFPEDEEI
jgi:chromosome partitioning protein